MRKELFKTQSKRLSLFLAFILSMAIFMGVFSRKDFKDVYAHDSYFVGVSYDLSGKRLIPIVVKENHTFVLENHREADLGSFSEKLINEDNTINTTVGMQGKYPTSGLEDIKKFYEESLVPLKGSDAQVFTFPAIHGTNVPGGNDRFDAGARDENLANRFAVDVIGGINDAYSFMQSVAKDPIDANATMKVYSQLFEAARGQMSTVTFGDTVFTVTKKDPTTINPNSGFVAGDFVEIKHETDSIIVPYKCMKGYLPVGERKAEIEYTKEYTQTLKKEKEAAELDWGMAVIQANFNYAVKNVTFSNITEITKPSQIALVFSDFLGLINSQVRQLLGLQSMPELMLNQGLRANSYYYGLMPNAWKSSANFLYIIMGFFAGMAILVAIIKLFVHRSFATVNPMQRISLIEGVKDLVLTSFLLAGFPLMFNVMARINFGIVDVLSASTPFTGLMGTASGTNSGVLGSVLIAMAFLIADIYFNFQYILRAITLAFLYGIAPVAIVSVAFGGKVKATFTNFMKQILGNIYIQTFHAVVVVFFTTITAVNLLSTMEILVVYYSFIPLTKLIKEKVFGLDTNVLEEASNLAGTASGVATGLGMGLTSGSGKGNSDSQNFAGNSGKGGNGGSSGGINSKISSALKSDKVIRKDGIMNKLGQRGEVNDFMNAGMQDASIGVSGVDGDNFSKKSLNQGTRKIASSKGLFKGPTGTFVTEAVKSGIGIGGKVLGSAAAGGLAFGLSAIGDSKGAKAMGAVSGKSLAGIKGDAIRPFTAARDATRMVRKTGINSIHQSTEGYIYKSGLIAKDNNITGVKAGDVYTSKFKGNYEKVQGLEHSQQVRVMQDIADAYMSKGKYSNAAEAESAREYYKKQGIIGVGLAKDEKNNLAYAYQVDKSALRNNADKAGFMGNIEEYQAKGERA